MPKPRAKLTLYHGMFATNSQHRALVTPSRRGRGNKAKASRPGEATLFECHILMIPDQIRGRLRAQRLKRVFDTDIEICGVCGGTMKGIACIEDPPVIKKMLIPLPGKVRGLDATSLPESRGHSRMTGSADMLE